MGEKEKFVDRLKFTVLHRAWDVTFVYTVH